MPDLVRCLISDQVADCGQPDEVDSTYTFRPVVLKKSAHTPDAMLWPRQVPGGSAALPVVLVEVQMHSDPAFHRRLQLGPTGPPLLQRFLEQDVTWVDLEALSLQPSLDPALALLTLPVQRESRLAPRCQELLEQRPDWIELILPILSERFPGLTTAELMTTFANFRDFWRDTPAYQDILQEGREEGRQEGRQQGRSEGLEEGRRREALSLAGRLLERRFGHLSPAISSQVEALSLPKLEEISLALLDFQSAEVLEEWLEQQEQG